MLRWVLGVSLLLVAGCSAAADSDAIEDSSKDDRITELEAEVSDLEDQLQAAKDAASDLRTANDDLGSAAAEARDAADRFQHENWRDVVPDAEAAADRVTSAQSDVESATTALDDAIEE